MQVDWQRLREAAVELEEVAVPPLERAGADMRQALAQQGRAIREEMARQGRAMREAMKTAKGL